MANNETFQSISVKSAEILVAAIREIHDEGVLNRTFIDPVGYGSNVLPDTINMIQKLIDSAKLINGIIGTNEIKINFVDGNSFFLITQIFKKYEERTNPKANGL